MTNVQNRLSDTKNAETDAKLALRQLKKDVTVLETTSQDLDGVRDAA